LGGVEGEKMTTPLEHSVGGYSVPTPYTIAGPAPKVKKSMSQMRVFLRQVLFSLRLPARPLLPSISVLL
jgi:hypothetical protein